MQVAFSEKQNNFLVGWLEDHMSSFYLMVDKDYSDCPSIQKWLRAAEKIKAEQTETEFKTK
jgi:hypothetical protein